MKNLIVAPMALVCVALALSGCFFPGGYHDHYEGGGYGGGYGHPVGVPPGPGPNYGGGGAGGAYQRSAGGYHPGY